jgi:hypothetical protein
MAGLEPAQISPPPPQGGVYTNFTTSAINIVLILEYLLQTILALDVAVVLA